jgi:hypothetical protein
MAKRAAPASAESATHVRRAKYETKVTKANDGNHSPRQTRKAWAWIDACSASYTSARLYHLVFVMADLEFRCFGVYHIHKALLKRLMQHLRRKGIVASYHAAREIDDEKGEHLHVFLAVEGHSPKRPDAILNRKPNDWLATYAATQGIKVYINEPRDPMHNGLDYMTLPASKPEKVADAKAWVSYLFKARSKPTSGEIYTSSRAACL